MPLGAQAERIRAMGERIQPSFPLISKKDSYNRKPVVAASICFEDNKRICRK
jgi:hypothetical protein